MAKSFQPFQNLVSGHVLAGENSALCCVIRTFVRFGVRGQKALPIVSGGSCRSSETLLPTARTGQSDLNSLDGDSFEGAVAVPRPVRHADGMTATMSSYAVELYITGLQLRLSAVCEGWA